MESNEIGVDIEGFAVDDEFEGRGGIDTTERVRGGIIPQKKMHCTFCYRLAFFRAYSNGN